MGYQHSKPILESKIVLRRLELSDAEPMLAWMKNPDIYEKMQYDPEQHNLESCINFIKTSWNDSDNLHYAVSDKSNEYLGTVSLKNIDRKNSNAELGIALCPYAMGRGIGTDALRAIMEVAFMELELNKVYLYVRSDNERAVAFYKKNHLEYEGCFKAHLKAGDTYRDIYWYALRRQMYLSWKQTAD